MTLTPLSSSRQAFDKIGDQAHPEQASKNYNRPDTSVWYAAQAELGAKHVRCGLLGDAAYRARVGNLFTQQGIKFTALIGLAGDTPSVIDTHFGWLELLITAYPGCVEMIENQNEPDANFIRFTITSLTRSGTTATATCSAAHGKTGTFIGTMDPNNAATLAAYNIAGKVCTVTGPTTFTFTVAGSPATPAVPVTASMRMIDHDFIPNHVACVQEVWAKRNASVVAGVSSLPVCGSGFVKDEETALGIFGFFGSLAAIVTHGCLHAYTHPSEPEFTGDESYAKRLLAVASIYPALPMVVTETGYYAGTASLNNTEAQQDAYAPRTLLLHILLGVARTFLYELLNKQTYNTDGSLNHASDLAISEDNFGMVRANGTRKPHFTTIKRWLDLFRDTDDAVSLADLGVTLSGVSTDIKSFLVQRVNGAYLLPLWWGNHATTDTPANNAGSTILTFATTMARVSRYDPSLSSTPTSVTLGVTSLSINLPDRPMALLIEPTVPLTATPTRGWHPRFGAGRRL